MVNRFKNWETSEIALLIDNSHELRTEVRRAAESCRQNEEPGDRVTSLANWLEDKVAHSWACHTVTSGTRNLLQGLLADVDWRALAEHWLNITRTHCFFLDA